MNYEEFKQEVADRIKEFLPEKYADADVSIQTVVKNNDQKLDYKSRGKEQEEKPRESLKNRLSEKKAEVSQQKHDAPQKTATKSKEASL